MHANKGSLFMSLGAGAPTRLQGKLEKRSLNESLKGI